MQLMLTMAMDERVRPADVLTLIRWVAFGLPDGVLGPGDCSLHHHATVGVGFE